MHVLTLCLLTVLLCASFLRGDRPTNTSQYVPPNSLLQRREPDGFKAGGLVARPLHTKVNATAAPTRGGGGRGCRCFLRKAASFDKESSRPRGDPSRGRSAPHRRCHHHRRCLWDRALLAARELVPRVHCAPASARRSAKRVGARRPFGRPAAWHARHEHHVSHWILHRQQRRLHWAWARRGRRLHGQPVLGRLLQHVIPNALRVAYARFRRLRRHHNN